MNILTQNHPIYAEILATLKQKKLRVSFLEWIKKERGSTNLIDVMIKEFDTDEENLQFCTHLNELLKLQSVNEGGEMVSSHPLMQSFEQLKEDAKCVPMDGTAHPSFTPDKPFFPKTPPIDRADPNLAPEAIVKAEVIADMTKQVEADTETEKAAAVASLDDLDGFRDHLQETKNLATQSMMNWDAYSKDKITDRLEELEARYIKLEANMTSMIEDFHPKEIIAEHANVDIAKITASITHAVLDELNRKLSRLTQ